MKNVKTEFGKAYLEFQPQLDALIKEVVLEAGSSIDLECWKQADECIDAIECRSRDGFIPPNHNCGGYVFQNFTTVQGIVGSGCYPASKEAHKQIDKQYDQACEYAKEWFSGKYGAELKAKGIPEDKWNYHDLYELGEGPLAERLSEAEHENAGEDSSSIMVEVRIMYHGVGENGVHMASVSAAVNWEGPYHRSHISWMPGFKCEHAKEVEVEFKTLKQAKTRLTKAINKVKGEII